MNLSANFGGNFIPLLQCSYCCSHIRSQSLPLSPRAIRWWNFSSHDKFLRKNHKAVCRLNETETEVESNDGHFIGQNWASAAAAPPFCRRSFTFRVTSESAPTKFGNLYKFFLLINPEDDKPVAVVVPKKTLQPDTTAVPEWFATGTFGLVTVFTLLLLNVPALQTNLLSLYDNVDLLKDGLPGALVTALIMGVHEISHILVAKEAGTKLGVPYFVPSWQRGPIAHLAEEITNADDEYVTLVVTVLLLGLLVCLPCPFPFTSDALNSGAKQIFKPLMTLAS